MTFPVVTVEIAFTTMPGDVPSWTDVSAYVDEVPTIKRGRDDEFSDNFAAGTATIVLDNTDRRFEPEFAAGPYYPDVRPMRRVRIRALWAAVTYDLFSGYIERWPVEYGMVMGKVVVTATDAFLPLAQTGLPGSVWEIEVLADNPIAWYRLGESSGTVMGDSSGSGHHGTYIGGPTFNSRTGLVSRDPNNGMAFNNGQRGDFSAAAALLAAPGSPPFTIEAWIQLPEQPAPVAGEDTLADAAVIVLGSNGAMTSPLVAFYVDGSTGVAGKGKLVMLIDDGGGSSFRRLVYSSVRVDDGRVHYVVAVATSGSDIALWIDGVNSTNVLTGWSGTPGAVAVWSWSIGGSVTRGGQISFAGVLDEVVFHTSALPSARIAAHYAAGTEPWASDTSGERVDKVLDAIGWPAADRDVDTGQSVLQATGLGGMALPYLQAVARSEAGAFFVTTEGEVRFRERHALLAAPYTVSQATFGDDGAELGYVDLKPDYSVDRVRNVIRRGRTGGSVQEARDATSIAEFLVREDSQTDLMFASDEEATDAAGWTLARRKDPALRFDALEVEPYGDETNLFPQLLGRSIGDRITVRRRPGAGGAMIEREVHIEGIQHRLGPGLHWRTRWSLSPADAAVTYWVWDTSTWDVSTRWSY